MIKIVLSMLFLAVIPSLANMNNTVIWGPNRSLRLAKNFVDGKLPCSKQTLVFPENLVSSLKIESKLSVKELILPVNGEIVFESEEIEFGGDSDDVNCTEGTAFFKDHKIVSSWADADVWQSDRFNEATPDAERVPCYNDNVEFPKDAIFAVFLPNERQMINSIKLNNQILDFNGFLNIIKHESDDTQMFLWNEDESTGLIWNTKACNQIQGCPCQNFPLEIDCSTKYCPKPSCLEPIQPIGHCCKICGGALAVEVNKWFNLQHFKEVVEDIVKSYGAEDLVYHIGRIIHDDKDLVQVVVVDKGGYIGTSAKVAGEIAYLTRDADVYQLTMISGTPLDKVGLGGKIAVSMFFLVVCVMGAIYVYYYKMPRLQLFSFLNVHDRHTTVSRFHRRTDSVVTLTRRDSSTSLPATAFRNPLYDSTRAQRGIDETSE